MLVSAAPLDSTYHKYAINGGWERLHVPPRELYVLTKILSNLGPTVSHQTQLYWRMSSKWRECRNPRSVGGKKGEFLKRLALPPSCLVTILPLKHPLFEATSNYAKCL